SQVGTRMGAESLLTMLGILFGGAVGFYSLIVQVIKKPREAGGYEESDED
ncbi:uncharacterized protein METZ01_LOCUS442677, partial [marine metagenome]